jgi:hypothetical protein
VRSFRSPGSVEGVTSDGHPYSDRLESLPGCSECAFLPYCGADPVYNWATQGDPVGHRPTSEFCRRQTAMFTYLFDRLRRGDDFVRRLFLAWATQ